MSKAQDDAGIVAAVEALEGQRAALALVEVAIDRDFALSDATVRARCDDARAALFAAIDAWGGRERCLLVAMPPTHNEWRAGWPAPETPAARAARMAAYKAELAREREGLDETCGGDIVPGCERWLMDGSIHSIGDGCENHRDRCAACGGVEHMQPIYAGIAYRCEKCGETR